MDPEYLNPWYAIEREKRLKKVYNRPDSAAFIRTPQPIIRKPKQPEMLPEEPPKRIRPADVVMMELAVKVRKKLRDNVPFIWPPDFYHDLCTSWFEEQKAKGLSDIVFLCGEEAEKAMGLFRNCGLACWYTNGKVVFFVPETKNQGNEFVPVINTVKIKRHYRKPIFQDNATTFMDALQKIADFAGFKGWVDQFLKGLSIMRNDQPYLGQENTFPIPKPYFKYLHAAQVTTLGVGMGSWYDLPTANSTKFKIVTQYFTTERDKALMYAINNC